MQIGQAAAFADLFGQEADFVLGQVQILELLETCDLFGHEAQLVVVRAQLGQV